MELIKETKHACVLGNVFEIVQGRKVCLEGMWADKRSFFFFFKT
jgi:hypothetical protein